MHKINIKSSNKSNAIIATLLIAIFGCITFLLPIILIYLIPQSGIGHYFYDHINYAFLSLPVIMYFSYAGIYYYKIKVDPYVIDITTYRTISALFKKKDFVDIPHTMLTDYTFFDRPLSFNKTLMLKIETDNGKKIAKRFNLSLISEKEIEKISNVFDRIIVNNN